MVPNAYLNQIQININTGYVEPFQLNYYNQKINGYFYICSMHIYWYTKSSFRKVKTTQTTCQNNIRLFGVNCCFCKNVIFTFLNKKIDLITSDDKFYWYWYFSYKLSLYRIKWKFLKHNNQWGISFCVLLSSTVSRLCHSICMPLLRLS